MTPEQPVGAGGALDRQGANPPLIEKWVDLMDSAIRVPGTNIRVGLDPILGFLLPGVGDSAGALLSLAVFATALREGVPVVILVRMLLNVLIDALVGAFPVLGDVFDVAFRANQRNYELVRRHGRGKEPVSASHYMVVALAVMVILASLVLPLLLLGALAKVLLGRE